VLGGFFAGYNWQWSNFVAGVEGDFSWLGRNTATDTETTFDTFSGAPRPDGNLAISAENRWLASLRGRIGWSGGPWLLYVTGGAAWTRTSATVAWAPIPGALVPAPSPNAVAFDSTRTGFAVGAGAEWMFAPGWSFRAEYLYYQFDGVTSPPLAFVVPAGNGCTPVGACGWNAFSSRLQINTVRVGVAYHFGGGGPVVARY
jgi:outer membrane immunogenic protein